MKIKELAAMANACRNMNLINTCTLDGKTILRQLAVKNALKEQDSQ